MKREDLDLDMATYAVEERIALVMEGAKVSEWKAKQIVERQMREQAEAQRELFPNPQQLRSGATSTTRARRGRS